MGKKDGEQINGKSIMGLMMLAAAMDLNSISYWKVQAMKQKIYWLN